MERVSRSRRVKQGNKENVPPPGVDSQRQKKSRKRNNSSVLANLASSKKKLKMTRARKELAPPETLAFLGLPYDVLDYLLQFLDVQTLEALGSTCSHFDLMINGRYLTSVRLPFRMDGSFMKEIEGSEVIEKKPVLRIRCQRVHGQEDVMARKYQLNTHLGLLSLKKVREVDLFPGKIPDGHLTQAMNHKWSQSQEFDKVILDRLSNVGALRNISRLNVMFNDQWQAQNIEKILPDLTNLQELHLFVAVTWRYDYSKYIIF